IGDVCNMFVFRTEKSGLLFRTEVDPAIPDRLYGDETRVRQIMTNLLNNAVKYTREGHVTLRVGEEKLPEEGEEQDTCLIISVSDTGIGIKPEDMGRLFTKFERLDMDRNSTIEGTGLGLVITKQIVDLMKGTVTVESAYGEGSTFEVRIPQKVLDPIPIGDFKERFRKMYEGGSRKLTPFTAQKARVLVVDDTEINLTVFKKLLSRNRLVVDTASSGLEALRYTQDTVYDVIFMDQRMPGMDGATTFAHIRSQNNGANKETPVICLTADAVFGARERYLEMGFTDYLSKPIDLEKLETVLLEYIPQEKIVRGDDAVLEIAEPKTPPQQEQAPEETTTLDEQTLHNLFTMSGVLSFRAAIRNCVDVDTLMVILKEYYDTIPENLEMLNRFLAESDMKNYNIKVHALKSSSRMIGALDFAEDAFRLERCSAEGKEEMVWELTPAFIKKYGEIRDALRTIMEKA
ncbi:MAG: response regulator, partial [Lachnospiraceae bacterium]|nr:response regulator [Lachnospiraceae bacterium]